MKHVITSRNYGSKASILLTKATAVQNEVALSYHRVRRLYFVAVVFMTTIIVEVEAFIL